MNFTLQRRNRGSVMIFAVLLMTAGVFVLTAVLQLAATQGLTGEEEWAAVQRRVTLGNSRAMGRQYMLTRIFRGTVPADPNQTSVTFTNALGGFAIQPAGSQQLSYWAALSTTNTDVVLNINPFNLMERGGFYREIFVGQFQEGDADPVNWSFALRTRSPVAAGYSFVQQRPANNNVSTLASPPYIDMSGTNEQFFGFYGLPRMPVSSVTNTMTRVTGDANGYQGFLDVLEGASTYGFFTNATYSPRENPPQTLQVVLDLNASDPNVDTSVLRYDVSENTVAYTNGTNVLNLPVRSVVLLGAPYAGQKPLHVVVPETQTNVSLLVLSNNNGRLVYFNRTKTTDDGVPFSVSAQGATSWRIGLTMTQCRLRFGLSGVVVRGGLRADSTVTFPSGAVEIRPENDPGGLDFIADRMMWLEDYRAQQ